MCIYGEYIQRITNTYNKWLNSSFVGSRRHISFDISFFFFLYSLLCFASSLFFTHVAGRLFHGSSIKAKHRFLSPISPINPYNRSICAFDNLDLFCYFTGCNCSKIHSSAEFLHRLGSNTTQNSATCNYKLHTRQIRQ